MRLKQAAAAFGIRHRVLELEHAGRKRWRMKGLGDFEHLEDATLKLYVESGWEGHAQEGGLLLSLIKAASFPALSKRYESTFIEALYAKNVGFGQTIFETGWLLSNIISSNEYSIRANFAVMSSTDWGRNGARTPQFFPTVTIEKIVGLYRAIGRGRLQSIAATFALDAYSYRSGWPDLTLWRGSDVVFKEVKGPGDQLQESQKRLYRDVLLPLGFDVELVEVIMAPKPVPEASLQA